VAAVFLGSYFPNRRLPERKEPGIAFLGRSNVGKSSVINLVTDSAIARVSKTPGRTQCLNLYLVDDNWVLGDFPGYGYAKVSKKQRRLLETILEKFLLAQYFRFAVQVIDARHPGLESDIQVQDWLKAERLPFLIVMNKVDKLNRKERAEVERQAKKMFVHQPLLFVSTKTKEGKKELQGMLHRVGASA